MNTNNIIPMHQIGFPINLENIISDSDSVRVLYDVMEGLDYSELNRTYSTIGRNPALLPKTMFAIIVYGYMEGIYSSRALEKACKRDINFKWLLQGQLPPAYNIQIGVEGEYIVGVDISSERSDQRTFIPFLDRLEKNLNQKYESVTADAGYESEENYAYLESKKQEAFIKPANYKKSKTKKFKSDISKKENMYYHTDEDY